MIKGGEKMLFKVLRLIILINFCLNSYCGGPDDSFRTENEKLYLGDTLIKSNVNSTTSSIFGNADSNLVIEDIFIIIPFKGLFQSIMSDEDILRSVMLPENNASISMSVEDPNPKITTIFIYN